MHTSGKIGLRWRTENEVVSGRGQFTCASKHCGSNLNLHSYEVPFEYYEKQIKKNELVKVRVCIECAKKLFYEKLRTMRKERRKRRRKSGGESGDEEDEGSAVITNSHDSIIQELFHFKELIECKIEKTETISQKRKSEHLSSSSAS
jgi:protein FRA10AC1